MESVDSPRNALKTLGLFDGSNARKKPAFPGLSAAADRQPAEIMPKIALAHTPVALLRHTTLMRAPLRRGAKHESGTCLARLAEGHICQTYMSGLPMIRTQVYLTEEQERGLKRLAAATGHKQSALIRAAIDGYLAREAPKDWRAALEAIRGMWADRDDLDDVYADLRSDWERREKRLPGG